MGHIPVPLCISIFMGICIFIVQLQTHHDIKPAHLSHPVSLSQVAAGLSREGLGIKKDLGGDLFEVIQWVSGRDGKQKVILWAFLALLFSNCFIGEEMLFKVEICDRP